MGCKQTTAPTCSAPSPCLCTTHRRGCTVLGEGGEWGCTVSVVRGCGGAGATGEGGRVITHECTHPLFVVDLCCSEPLSLIIVACLMPTPHLTTWALGNSDVDKQQWGGPTSHPHTKKGVRAHHQRQQRDTPMLYEEKKDHAHPRLLRGRGRGLATYKEPNLQPNTTARPRLTSSVLCAATANMADQKCAVAASAAQAALE